MGVPERGADCIGGAEAVEDDIRRVTVPERGADCISKTTQSGCN